MTKKKHSTFIPFLAYVASIHSSPTPQVLEMYSSGGDLHLELPEGGQEADTALWQVNTTLLPSFPTIF